MEVKPSFHLSSYSFNSARLHPHGVLRGKPKVVVVVVVRDGPLVLAKVVPSRRDA